ncbi:MAG: hypothetical protein ACKKL4_03025 [Patescibacteria group bacterium]
MPPKKVEIPPRSIEDEELIKQVSLELPNKEIVDAVLQKLPPELFEHIEDVSQFLNDLDERAKDKIFEQKDKRQIIEELLVEETRRRKKDLENFSRNVKTGQERVASAEEERKVWEEYERENKKAQRQEKIMQTFDKYAFRDGEQDMSEAIDALGEGIDAQVQEIKEIERAQEKRYQSQVASDKDIKKYRSFAPLNTPEGRIRAIKERRHLEDQEKARERKNIEQARAEQLSFARQVDHMKYGENDAWTKRRLDLEAELSNKSKKRQTEKMKGYSREEHEKFGFETPENYVKRIKQEREHDSHKRSDEDAHFSDPIDILSEGKTGTPYKTILEQGEVLKDFNATKIEDWKRKLDVWKKGEGGLTIEEIRNEFPLEALEAYDEIGYKQMPEEIRKAWSVVGATWDSYKRGLGLRNGDREVYNEGVRAKQFRIGDTQERARYIQSDKAYHREVVQAQADLTARMEKIKQSDDPKLLAEYRTLARYARELAKQEGYTLSEVHSMEGYKHHSEKLSEMNRAFLYGNLSIGEYVRSPFKNAYHLTNMARHSYSNWEQGALLRNQKNNSGFERWAKDKLIRTPRAIAYTGLGAPVVLLVSAMALVWSTWKIGKFIFKKAKGAPKKGDKINNAIDTAFFEKTIIKEIGKSAR